MTLPAKQARKELITIALATLFIVVSFFAMLIRLDHRLHQHLEAVDWIIISADVVFFVEQIRALVRKQMKKTVAFTVVRALLFAVTFLRLDLPAYIALAGKTYLTHAIAQANSPADRVNVEWSYTAVFDKPLTDITWMRPDQIIDQHLCRFVTNEYYGFLDDPLLTDVRENYQADVTTCRRRNTT